MDTIHGKLHAAEYRCAELEQSLWARDRDCAAKDQQISELVIENERLKGGVADYILLKDATISMAGKQINHLQVALAAAQARETKLREIVSTLETKYSLNSEIRELCCPPTADDAALRDMIVEVYEKCEQACNTARVDALGCNAAEIIRTLSVNHWSS